jgi:hypothetical protein
MRRLTSLATRLALRRLSGLTMNLVIVQSRASDESWILGSFAAISRMGVRDLIPR